MHFESSVMIKKLISYQTAVLLLVYILVSGCAGKVTKDVELYWPLPPEQPRIKWVGWIRGEQDVRKETAGQKFLNAVIGEQTKYTSLRKPYGVHARDGRVYVSDTFAGKVAVFDLDKKDFFVLGKSGLGILSKPIGIATDDEGYIYVTDTNQDRAIVYEHSGKFSHTLGEKDQFEQPGGIAINDTLDRIYVIDIKKHHVQVFNRQGQYLFQFGERGSEDGEFNFPINIFIDSAGKVYVSDSMNFRVQMFDADGNFLDKFGSLGDAPSQFARPKGVAVDSEGHIYVVDAAFNNVQIFDNEGQLLLFFGQMGIGPGGFWLPAGMFIDENDKIYVADQYNRRVNIFQYMGEKYRKSLEQADQ